VVGKKPADAGRTGGEQPEELVTEFDDVPAQPEAASAPIRILAGGGERVPVIFDSPHSGRAYPGDFQPLVPLPELYGFEDRLVDTLIEPARKHGISVLSAQFPRAYIDPNRSEDDLEPEITGPDWPGVAQPVYATRGIGLIFRNALGGTPLYERPLDPEEIDRRIRRYWRPYHDALQDLMDSTARAWGAVWHVNWHSMRPVGDDLSSDPGAIRPDFVVSDLDGTSAEPRFVDLVEGGLRGLGYSTARNQPFKGGYITQRHGRPDEGRHSIQVEINRALYLDLQTLEVTAGAVRLRADLDRLAADIAAYARAEAPLTPD
jgi:N-formylglutamate deformylase